MEAIKEVCIVLIFTELLGGMERIAELEEATVI